MDTQQRTQKEARIVVKLSLQESFVRCEGNAGALVALLVRAFMHSDEFHTLMKEALGLYGVVGDEFKDFLKHIDRSNGGNRA